VIIGAGWSSLDDGQTLRQNQMDERHALRQEEKPDTSRGFP
jgi:hypothetical protein